ncbi:MAG: EamA family transporter [Candidatus Rokubacteria bacterium]|nr:EamA family transporter [Candidatus Rokubacteria bacterium]
MPPLPGPRPHPRAWLGYALVAAAAASWGAQSVVAKLLLTGGLDPAALISTRCALATLVMVVALAAIEPRLLRVGRPDLGRLVVLGVVGMAFSNYTYYFALQRIPVATAALLIYTAPLLVLAASVFLYREPLRRTDVLAATGTLLGAALVVRAYHPTILQVNLAGIAASILNAVAWAFYSLWGKTLSPRVSPWTMLTYSLGSGAAFWLLLAPPWRLLAAAHPPLVWAGIAVVVLFGTLLPFALFLAGLARISAAHASVTATVEPVVAAAVAFAVLGESLEWPQLVGGVLILAGIGLLHVR